MPCWLMHDWKGWSDEFQRDGRIYQRRECWRCHIAQMREVKVPSAKWPAETHAQNCSSTKGD